MSWGHSDGWSNREATASLVITLISCRTLWHLGPRDNCEASGNVKTIEKAQIIKSEFRKQPSIVGKMDQIDKGQNGQFTLRGDS